MRKNSFIVIVALLLMIFSTFSPKAYAASANGRPKFVIVVMNKVGLRDYVKYELPNIKKLIQSGALGLLNVRTAKNYHEPSAYLSIGAGSRAESDYNGGYAFNYNEMYDFGRAGELYHIYTGNNASKGDVVNLSINSLKEVSAKQDHQVVPGLLGQILKDKGIPVAVLGNADLPDTYRRYVSLIGMDENGKVKGDVSGNLSKDDMNAPYLMSTDYDKLYDEYQKYSSKGGLLVIELGDTSRADDFTSMTTPDLGTYYREQALKKADAFVGKIARSMDFKKDILMIVTPYPSKEDIASNHLLTPILVVGDDYKGGFITSFSTKRLGIAQNIDIAPTVLHFFDISVPKSMMGLPLTSIQKSPDIGEVQFNTAQSKLNYLSYMNEKIVATYVQRPFFIKTYVIVQIVVLFLAIMALFFRDEYAKHIKPLILANMAVPLVFLILPVFDVNSAFFKAVIILAVLIAMVFLSLTLSRNNMDVIMTLCIITAALLAMDILTGQKLMKNSILGYDPIIGARYYGIGNEYMGVLMGSSIIGLTALIDRYKKPFMKYVVSAIFIFLIYIISAPSLGTKLGGFIVSFMAYGTSMLLLFNFKFNKKNFVYLFGFMLIMMIGLFIYDMLRGGQSHIGRTALLVREEGIMPLLMIFQRKLSMNIKLIRYTIWTKVLITFILVLGFLFYKPTNILINIFKRNKAVYAGFLGSTVGMLFALVFNDAGIVAAATMFIFVVPSFLVMVIDELSNP
ncbi:hypothetical protein SAMN02746089_00510 [Caldanaerobius fijiensis DSM 17918]|uniref:Phosphoglyceromutase n=1 Tax=Caldanaerobius fijiensis DSM 17918 TaxID=1121256 RepID=A0A1M4UUN8_9THEO|nr:hypothetical protein [Caldanaerobius fijiensis]SHE60404.1 hypothetical protein SAMN02746089_00510 [Caldanaerobius fijiensis DSM 17918]